MATRNDEVLIRLHEDMSEREIVTELAKISKLLHRILQLSIDAGAVANQTYFNMLQTGCANVEHARLLCDSTGIAANPAPQIHRPQ